MALDVLDCARLGTVWEPPPPKKPFTSPLPEQLPAGVVWVDTLPLVLDWPAQPEGGGSGGSRDEHVQ